MTQLKKEKKTYMVLKQPPPNDPIMVMTAARAAYCHLAPLTPYVLPELKANQPHHRTNKPMQAFTGLPRGSGSVPWAYRPSLGPSIAADANAAAPPVSMIVYILLVIKV